MKSKYDALQLTEFLKDFYTVVDIRISVFDDEFNLVAEYPEEPPAFCAIIRRSAQGLAACKRCDREAFERASRTREAHQYTCHAGLTEAITSIQLDDHIIGYAIFAHLMPQEDQEARLAEIFRRSRKYFADDAQLLDAVRALPQHPASTIRSSMRLLEAIAAFLQLSKVASWSPRDIAYQMDKFIANNLAGDLSSDILCRRFLLSRTKLYQIAKENFGMSIMQYVASRRVQKAKELLKETDLGIKDIADRVGISDYNYFGKLFKKATGLTPGEFRRR